MEETALLALSEGMKIEQIQITTTGLLIQVALDHFGGNCQLPMQKENSGVRNFLLPVACKRAVSPQIGQEA